MVYILSLVGLQSTYIVDMQYLNINNLGKCKFRKFTSTNEICFLLLSSVFASNINNLCRGQQSILNSIICIISYEADKVNGFLLLRAFRSLTLHIKAMIDRILSLKTQKNEDSAQTKRCTWCYAWAIFYAHRIINNIQGT